MTAGAGASASLTTYALLPGLSLVLPVHNESENLRWLIPHAADVLPTLAQRVEVVLVDDGSDDGSAALAVDLARQSGLALRVVTHERKSGYGITVADGLRAARLDYVAFTDADGQFELADLRLLVPELERADLVGGWRLDRRDSPFRSLVSGVFNLTLRVLYGVRVRDVDCALKLMRREFLNSIEITNRSALVNAELYLRAQMGGWRVGQVGVPHHPRRAGRRSGARPRAILRAIRELIVFRFRLARSPVQR